MSQHERRKKHSPRHGGKPSPAQPRSPLANAIKIRYLDAQIIVVDKPAGLTTVRHKSETQEHGRRAKFLPPTLVDLLPSVLPSGGVGRPAPSAGRPSPNAGRIRAVHRLDKETSGLLVLARTPAAETNLGLQFRAHTIERTYLALVRGRAKAETIESYLVDDRGDGRRGSGSDETGQLAVTHVEIAEKLGEFTLIASRLETGRTHQVRIHLGERGTPLCGDRVYDRPLNGKPLPDTSGAKRPLLHAAYLAIDHPATGKRMSWKANVPADFDEVVRKTRYRLKTRGGNGERERGEEKERP